MYSEEADAALADEEIGLMMRSTAGKVTIAEESRKCWCT